MSTSLLYHALNIVGYHHRETEYVGSEIRFAVEQDPTTLRCPGCGPRNVIRRGTVNRRFRAPVLAFKQIVIKLAVQRIECRTEGRSSSWFFCPIPWGLKSYDSPESGRRCPEAETNIVKIDLVTSNVDALQWAWFFVKEKITG